jgi:molybdenum-dependent DNA-binding transcriptional regulator ModE
VFLGFVRAFGVIERDAWEFLDHLMDMNSTRVQSDVIRRVEESRGQLEAEIRKLLHEISRIAEQALDHARATRAEGASVVEAALARLDAFEGELSHYGNEPKQ